MADPASTDSTNPLKHLASFIDPYGAMGDSPVSWSDLRRLVYEAAQSLEVPR
jgi:hypothetical protein